MKNKNYIPNRLIQSIKNRGIRKSLISAYSYFYDYYFDKKYNVDSHSWVTVNDLDIEDSNKEHAVLYQGTRVLPLRKLFKTLNLPKELTLVDIGCGKGRVLILASEFGFKKVVGVELSSQLCSIAQKNIVSFQDKTQKKTSFLVINEDAANYQYSDDEDVFFLYNPFDEVILEKVLQNITASLKRCNRRVWMIYANAVHRELIEKKMKIIEVKEFVYLGFDFVVYQVELLNNYS